MANWKKVLVSGSNISELNNDLDYLLAVGDGVVSGSSQITLGGDLVGTANNAELGVGVVENINVANNAGIEYTKIDFTNSNIVSGSINLSGYVTTASFNTYTASTDLSISILDGEVNTLQSEVSTLQGEVSTLQSEVSDLQAWSSSLDTNFVSEAELTAFSSSNATYIAGISSSIDNTIFNLSSSNSTTFSNYSSSTATVINDLSSSVATTISNLSSSIDNTIFNLSSSNSTTFSNFSSSVATEFSNAGTSLTNLSSSLSTRLTSDEEKYDAYTSSFTTTTLNVLGNAAVTGAFGVQGNTSFGNDVVVEGNLTVNGTASFVNVQELSIADKFITLASGSNSLTDAGIIFQSSTSGVGSGPALFLEATSTGDYGRMAMATSVDVNALAATPAAYVTTTEVGTGAAPAAPTFGGTTNGSGNIYVDSLTGDIFIYA